MFRYYSIAIVISVFFILTSASQAQGDDGARSVAGSHFVHTAEASNVISNYTTLDHPDLNGNPDAVFHVTQAAGVDHEEVVGVFYRSNGKWAIYNQDISVAMPIGATFNVVIPQYSNASFVHTSTAANAGTFGESKLSHFRINNNPNALILVTHNFNPGGIASGYNDKEIGVYYNTTTGIWSVFNQDLTGVVHDRSFNILMLNNDAFSFVHTVAANNLNPFGDSQTLLDHPMLNGNPNAIVHVAQNWNANGSSGIYNNQAVSVFYVSQVERWLIRNIDSGASLPLGADFNVSIDPDTGCQNPFQVSNLRQLNAGIACYNERESGTYSIVLAKDIYLDAATEAIRNFTDAELVISGDNQFKIDGNGMYRGFNIEAGNVEIVALEITNCKTPATTVQGTTYLEKGGAIYADDGANLTIKNSTISNSHARWGGGIYKFAHSLTAPDTFLLEDSVVISNTASAGGGVYMATTVLDRESAGELGTFEIRNSVISGNVAIGDVSTGANGGGIMFTAFAEQLLIDKSTISSNSASRTGGGIYNDGDVLLNQSLVSSNTSTRAGGGISNQVGAELTAKNSTLSGNIGRTGGGGLFSSANSVATFWFSTIARNRTANLGSAGGGIYNENGTVALNSSIVAGNISVFAHDLVGTNDATYMSQFTIIADAGSSAGIVHNVDNNIVGDAGVGTIPFGSLLVDLEDNGGPTHTHALVEGSLAIDSASNTDCGTQINFVDQRNFGRIDGMCDRGAYESRAEQVENIQDGDHLEFIEAPGLEFDVITDNDWDCATVEQFDEDHPAAEEGSGSEPDQHSGVYWRIHAYLADCATAASGYDVSVTLPHDDLPNPTACRFDGSEWQCFTPTAATSTSITVDGITGFSDWAVGSSMEAPTAVTLTNTALPLSANRTAIWVAMTALTLLLVATIWLAATTRHLPTSKSSLS